GSSRNATMPLLACLLLPLWRHPFKGFQQRTRQKRLAQIGNATCLERRLSRGLVIGTSHVNDWKHGARCLQLTMQLKPRHAAEMNVKEDAVKIRPPRRRQEKPPRTRRLSRKAERTQQTPDRRQHCRVVVHDHYGFLPLYYRDLTCDGRFVRLGLLHRWRRTATCPATVS